MKSTMYQIGLAKLQIPLNSTDLKQKADESPKPMEFGCIRRYSHMTLKMAKKWRSYCSILKGYLTIERIQENAQAFLHSACCLHRFNATM